MDRFMDLRVTGIAGTSCHHRGMATPVRPSPDRDREDRGIGRAAQRPTHGERSLTTLPQPVKCTPSEPTPRYCVPKGTPEDAYAVGHAIARLVDSLDAVNETICDGEIVADVGSLSYLILQRLKSEGWRVSVTALDRWDIRPPAGEKSVE